MRSCWFLFCLILVAVACLPGYATLPSFRGYTGLVIIPTADTLGKGDWNAGVFMKDVDDGSISDVVANYGVIPGLEVGIDRFKMNEDSDSQTLVNAKYRFMSETLSRPAIAAGVIDLTDDVETTVYAVISKSFGCNIRAWEGELIAPRIHIGWGGGRLSGLFIGGSAWIGTRLELMAEWDSENVQAGIRYRLTPEFTFHAAGFNLTDNEDDEFSEGISFGLGLSYNMTY